MFFFLGTILKGGDGPIFHNLTFFYEIDLLLVPKVVVGFSIYAELLSPLSILHEPPAPSI